MIRITRPAEAPATLRSKQAQDIVKTLRDHATRGKPPGKLFNSLWLRNDVRDALYKMQYKKCAYCERVRERTREPDVEHFRPKGGIAEAPDHYGYWWLAYDWTNLLFSCRPCNQDHKKNQFPIPIEAKRASAERDDISSEEACLLDPCRDDPEAHLTYDWGYGAFVQVIPRDGSVRGKVTRDVLGLNCGLLPEEREEVRTTLEPIAEFMFYARRLRNPTAMAEAEAQIREETKASRRFAGFRRDYFKRMGFATHVSSD